MPGSVFSKSFVCKPARCLEDNTPIDCVYVFIIVLCVFSTLVLPYNFISIRKHLEILTSGLASPPSYPFPERPGFVEALFPGLAIKA
jgi:hypothetical protein